MFHDFSQLARFTSATPRRGGFGRTRDLSLPNVEWNPFEFNTENTNSTFSSELIVTTTTTVPETGDLFQSQTKHDRPKFSLIEFLVERTAGFATAQTIFGTDSELINSEALRTWSFEHGIDQDELSFMVNQAGPIQVSQSETRMSLRFSNLQEASMKRQEGLQILKTHFSRSY